MTLFPAFSTLEGIKNRETLAILFARSVKYVLLVMVPIAVVAWLFAEEAMGVWLGSSLASESILVLKILALGVLLNSLALIPFTLLQGIGRPDLPAKFHLIELPVYVGIAWLLISRWGIAGAAWAWTLRMALDCSLLFAAAFRVRRFSSRLWASRGAVLVYLSLLAFSGMAYALKRLAGSLPLFAQTLLLIGLLALFALHTWTRILDTTERRVVVNALKPRRKVEDQEPRSV
jgi:O-antigen/teichoic acid export membrane protein